MSKKIRKPGRPPKKKIIDLHRLPLPEVPREYVSEMFNRLIMRALDREPQDSMEAANAFLQKNFTGRRLDDIIEETDLCPEDRAQVFAFAAMESDEPMEMIAYTLAALALDPYCLDALSLKAAGANSNLHGVMADMRKIAADAESRMGPEFIAENRGEFWGHPFTRPYMRLLFELVSLNLRHGSQHEAIRLMEKMLDLNPNDNQGIRGTLLPIYLKNDLLEKARALIEKYPEPMAVHMYCLVLERFLAGDPAAAKKALKKARKGNKHVVAYLIGDRPIDPEDLPPFFEMGKDSEAQHCAFEILPAWNAHPQAIAWLKEQA